MSAAPTANVLMTAAQAERIRRDGPWEVVGGELRAMVPAGFDHGAVALNMGFLLRLFVREHGGRAAAAETGFVLQERPLTLRAPDAAYVGPARLAEVGSSPGFWPGAAAVGRRGRLSR
jgi:Uma2 family endonuclease